MDLLTKLMNLYESDEEDDDEEEIDGNIYVDYNVVWRGTTK
jgi:hypothetical protein